MVGLKNPSKESKAEVMSISRNIAQTVTKMAKLAEKLKGGDWVDPDDPMLIAENELLNAAQSIELAAKRLATLRPRKEVSGQVWRNTYSKAIKAITEYLRHLQMKI